MPPKIRDLKKRLRKVGFANPSGRGEGSHSFWVDPDDAGNRVNLSGQDGDDAKPYQIRETEQAIKRRQKPD